MKNLFTLITALMVIVGCAQAQDVYFAGQSSDSAKVWKNNILIYSHSDTLTPTIRTAKATESGDVFLAGHRHGTTGRTTAILWKNGEIVTSVPNASFNSLSIRGNDQYTAGFTTDTLSGLSHASVWKDGEVLFFPSDSSLNATINAIDLDEDGNIYTAGHHLNSDSTRSAIVWANNDTLFTIEAENACLLALLCNDNDIYTAGYVQDTSQTHATLWQNGDIIFQSDSTHSRINAICRYNDTLYLAGQTDSHLVVWKNDAVLYAFDIVGDASLNAIAVNEFGIYCAGKTNGRGTIWENGVIRYQPDNCDNLVDVSAFADCDGLTRTLPWLDGFEELTTDWGCWTTLDFDSNTDTTWQRNTVHAASGDFSARHLACDNIQEGWLVTPPIFLQPNRDSTWMHFCTMVIRPENHTYSGVWVSTTGTAPSCFSEIWSQESPSNTWDSVSIDLSSFQGEKIHLAFKYSGHHGHDWYLDDIQLHERFAPRDTITEFTYSDYFDNGLSEWHIIDEDLSGRQTNWKLFGQGHEGTACLGHEHDTTEILQKAWAISRPMHLENDMFYTLRFQNSVSGFSERDHSAIYIADNVNHIPSPEDFTPIAEITENTNGWQETTLNLNAYAGHDIYLAFVYDGHDHDWMIDSITVSSRIAEYTINVVADNPDFGQVSGGGTFPVHDTIQIEAAPNTGYDFIQWDDENTDNPRIVIVREDHTYTAHFGIRQCTITTNVTPEGAGTIEGGGVYDYGTTAILMAQANPGHQFTQWSDGNTDNPRSILVEGDADYTAEFLTFQYEITTLSSPEEGGTVTGAGTYYYGDTIELQASPNNDFLFLCWSDGIPSNPRHVTVTQDATFTAMFYRQGTPEYTITVQSANPLLGSVTGSGVYPSGAVVQISASPSPVAVFTQWDDGNTDNPREITVTSDQTYTAHFETAQTCTITVVSQNPLMGTVYGGGTYRIGESIQIGANPNEGYHFAGWQDNDMNNPRTITVTEDATYVAIFGTEPVMTYNVTVYYDNQQGMVLGAGTYSAGSTATLAAIPSDGYQFAKWSDDNTENPRTFIVDRDIILAAFFNSTGVEETQGRLLKVFPNPACDKVHIDGLVGENKIEVYDSFGTLISTIINDGDVDININDFAAGLYIIRIGQYYGKFVKH